MNFEGKANENKGSAAEAHLRPALRDETWLNERLALICRVHFADVPRGHPIDIRFGIRARYRFGSIAARKGRTVILINRLFADPEVPEVVVDGTIAHEMAHYAHGFGSGLPKLYSDPHRGGVVDRELEKRGLKEVERAADAWRVANWQEFYASRCGDIEARKEDRQAGTDAIWLERLALPGARTTEDLNQRLAMVRKHMQSWPGEPVFQLEWMHASLKQTGLSYLFADRSTLCLHGLLADRRVPDAVIDFELAYWIARLRSGSAWPVIERYLLAVGMGTSLHAALLWRRTKWNAFRNRNHPLKSG